MSAFGKRPLAYVCFLCGQQYGSQSLLIHVPQCAAKWCQQHNAAAPPAAPPELPSSAEQLPRGAAAVGAFNAAMSSYWQQAALQRCPHCNRTFRLEALASHSKVCTAERPHKPLAKPHSASAAAAAAAAAGGGGGASAAPAIAMRNSSNHSSSSSSSSKVVAGGSKLGAATSPSSNSSSKQAAAAGHICGDMCLDSSGPNQSPSSSGSGGPGRMPRALVCYLCGGQFLAKSLPIHLPQCQAKWTQQQMLLPPAQRLPLPQPPAALSGVLGGGTALPAPGKALQEFNDAAFDTFNSASLVPCKACGRTFRLEALAHHAKHCTPDKPMQGPRQ